MTEGSGSCGGEKDEENKYNNIRNKKERKRKGRTRSKVKSDEENNVMGRRE